MGIHTCITGVEPELKKINDTDSMEHSIWLSMDTAIVRCLPCSVEDVEAKPTLGRVGTCSGLPATVIQACNTVGAEEQGNPGQDMFCGALPRLLHRCWVVSLRDS